MLQQAIIFTKDNASLIADSLIEYTAQELLDDYDYMFNSNHGIVLVRSLFDDGSAVLSHVVTTSMFFANAKPATLLNDTTFVNVIQL